MAEWAQSITSLSLRNGLLQSEVYRLLKCHSTPFLPRECEGGIIADRRTSAGNPMLVAGSLSELQRAGNLLPEPLRRTPDPNCASERGHSKRDAGESFQQMGNPKPVA